MTDHDIHFVDFDEVFDELAKDPEFMDEYNRLAPLYEHLKVEYMSAGSAKAIVWEIKHGNLWTVVDEIWHRAEWLLPELHYRFCQWCHL